MDGQMTEEQDQIQPEGKGSPDRRTGDRRAEPRRSKVERRMGLDRRRGPGRRRAEIRKNAEEGEMAGELLEFVMTVDEYKRINDRPFPSWSEIFEIIQYLGYRRVEERAEHINRPTETSSGKDSGE
jgi:hypothetical protein